MASFISMELAGAGEQFARTTRDFDMVILIDEINTDFQEAIWRFIHEGQYEVQRSEEQHNLYRFKNPGATGYPSMLELFSRVPQNIVFQGEGRVTPIPANEEAESLSALIMDESAYQYLRAGVNEYEGVSYIGPERLIPLKIKAYYNLKDSGQQSKKYYKHLGDVFKLLTILPINLTLSLPADMQGAVERLVNDPDVQQINIAQRWNPKDYHTDELIRIIRDTWL